MQVSKFLLSLCNVALQKHMHHIKNRSAYNGILNYFFHQNQFSLKVTGLDKTHFPASFVRFYSADKPQLAKYEDIKNVDPNKRALVDVRERAQVKKAGKLPNAINIPLEELEQALKLKEKEFKAKYAAEKPEPNKEIIFADQAGTKSAKALQLAQKLGYKKARDYKGGYEDYQKRRKQEKK